LSNTPLNDGARINKQSVIESINSLQNHHSNVQYFEIIPSELDNSAIGRLKTFETPEFEVQTPQQVLPFIFQTTYPEIQENNLQTPISFNNSQQFFSKNTNPNPSLYFELGSKPVIPDNGNQIKPYLESYSGLNESNFPTNAMMTSAKYSSESYITQSRRQNVKTNAKSIFCDAEV
ncbi:hypothetical protein HK096_006363, partial [Nowakowskiella sp. JEL0078]